MSRAEADRYLEATIKFNKDLKRNIEILDEFDFSEFLTNGRSLLNIYDAIEEKYDEYCRAQYGMYLFECLGGEDLCNYFASRYNVWFQEYVDWVVRNEDGAHEKARRRA